MTAASKNGQANYAFFKKISRYYERADRQIILNGSCSFNTKRIRALLLSFGVFGFDSQWSQNVFH